MGDDPVLHVLTAQSDAAKRGALAVWTVYDRPDDYPYGFIARMVEVASGGTTTPTSMVLTGELAGIRRVLAKARRIRLDRKPDDGRKSSSPGSRAFCIWLYPYPAFLRYAAHSAGGYWARILPLASEIAS